MFDFEDLEEELPPEAPKQLPPEASTNMFDFEDLEEELPPEAPKQLMSDDAFVFIKKHLRAATYQATAQDIAEGLAATIAAALWTEEVLPTRIPRLIEAMVTLAQEKDGNSGMVVMWALQQLSWSQSMHRVLSHQARPPQKEGAACCALILGFAGSALEDLEPQFDWYRDRGYSVVVAGPCQWPVALQQQQNMSIVRALNAALGCAGPDAAAPRLVVHLCSQGGVAKGLELLYGWIEGQPPFDALPPLRQCLAALVFECAPCLPIDPRSGKLIVGKSLDEGSEVFETQVSTCIGVLTGSVGAFMKRFTPTLTMINVAGKSQKFRANMHGAARIMIQGLPGDRTGATMSDNLSLFKFMDWMNAGAAPLPQLFLYSEKDALVTEDYVVAFVEHTRRCSPEAMVVEARAKQSEHCKLWETEPEVCQSALHSFLSDADL